MELLNFKNVSFGYKKEQQLLLNNISFSLLPNSFLFFFGSNGVGKTTLFNLIMKKIKPVQGEILVYSSLANSFNISYLPQREQFNISFVKVIDIVASSFISSKTVLLFGYKKHKEQAYESLKKLEIESLADLYFRNLSYGQMQKVLLAYIISNPKSIILLDEPMSNLDQEAKYFFYQKLVEIVTNKVIIMISHDIFLFSEHKGTFMTIKDSKIEFYENFEEVDRRLFHYS